MSFSPNNVLKSSRKIYEYWNVNGCLISDCLELVACNCLVWHGPNALLTWKFAVQSVRFFMNKSSRIPPLPFLIESNIARWTKWHLYGSVDGLCLVHFLRKNIIALMDKTMFAWKTCDTFGKLSYTNLRTTWCISTYAHKQKLCKFELIGHQNLPLL